MIDPAARPEPKAIPAEIDRWNWGAFLLNWIWGVGNNTFIALLTLIPFFGILIMPFVLGAKGSAWAYRHAIRFNLLQRFIRKGGAELFGDRHEGRRRGFPGSSKKERCLVDHEARAQGRRPRRCD
jgi:hypothetical protein